MRAKILTWRPAAIGHAKHWTVAPDAALFTSVIYVIYEVIYVIYEVIYVIYEVAYVIYELIYVYQPEPSQCRLVFMFFSKGHLVNAATRSRTTGDLR